MNTWRGRRARLRASRAWSASVSTVIGTRHCSFSSSAALALPVAFGRTGRSAPPYWRNGRLHASPPARERLSCAGVARTLAAAAGATGAAASASVAGIEAGYAGGQMWPVDPASARGAGASAGAPSPGPVPAPGLGGAGFTSAFPASGLIVCTRRVRRNIGFSRPASASPAARAYGPAPAPNSRLGQIDGEFPEQRPSSANGAVTISSAYREELRLGQSSDHPGCP
jgi:hypothetical protein